MVVTQQQLTDTPTDCELKQPAGGKCMVLGKMTVTFPSGSEREPRLTCRRLRGRRAPSHGHGHPNKPVARGCRLVNTEARCCPARLPARGPEGLPPGPHCRRSGHAVCMRPRVHGRETDPARGLGCPRGVIFAYLFLKKVSNSLDAQPGVRGNRGPPPSGWCGRFLRLLKWVGLAALDPGRVLVPRSLPGGLPPAPRALTQKPLGRPLSRAEGRHGRTSADRRHRAPAA